MKLSGPTGGVRLDIALEAGRNLVASESESDLSTTDGEGDRWEGRSTSTPEARVFRANSGLHALL